MNTLRALTTAIVSIAMPLGAAAGTFTFTSSAEFETGTLNGVNTSTADQLQIDASGSTFPVLWVANAGEDSMSKIDVNGVAGVNDAGCEVARYKTWLDIGLHGAFDGPAPSRTAVDGDGNVYVANREFRNRRMTVLKILASGGIDRNGDGVIQTSADLDGDCQITGSELIQHVDDNGDGTLETSELRDERIAWIVEVPTPQTNSLGRALCLDPDGDVWVGDWNNRTYYELDPDDGSLLRGPQSIGVNPYGCVVRPDGTLFSASLSSTMGRLDTGTGADLGNRGHSGSHYGITAGNGQVYLANRGGGASPVIAYDPATDTFSYPGTFSGGSQATYGIGVDSPGDIYTGRSTITKWDAAGARLWQVANPAGLRDQRGLLPDSNGDVWVINKDAFTVTKFDGATGTFLGTVPVGRFPYTYSDATGIGFNTVTNPQGIWTVVVDGGADGYDWQSIGWNTEPEGSVPPGASILVDARAADATGDLGALAYTPPVGNGAGGLGLTGRYIEVRARLVKGTAEESPILSDLAVAGFLQCDIDESGQVDITDIRAITAARNTPAGPGDPRDNDGDGVITVLDARQCVLLCTNPRCAP